MQVRRLKTRYEDIIKQITNDEAVPFVPSLKTKTSITLRIVKYSNIEKGKD